MTAARRDSMSWPRSPAQRTGVSMGTVAGAWPGPGSAGEMHDRPASARGRLAGLLLPRGPPALAYWDKKHGLWRVAEGDPDSDLYAESSDADTAIDYVTAHS